MTKAIEAIAHTSKELGIKTSYEVNKGQYSECQLDFYFFIPKTLGINKETYTKGDFFGNLTEYVSFRIPEMSIAEMVNLKNLDSPLTKISKLYEVRGDITRIREEIKLAACIFQGQMKKISKNTGGIEKKLGDITAFRNQFFELMQKGPAELKETYQLADEYLSLTIDYGLNLLAMKTKDKKIKRKVNNVIYAEELHRKNAGYSTILKTNTDNEKFNHQRNLLKKIVYNVLFLDVREKKNIDYLSMFYSIAAAIAMFVFLMISLIYQSMVASSTFMFVLTTVIAYALKDRIKEGLKFYFRDIIGKKFPDRQLEIFDSTDGKVVGECKESFYFAESIPESIKRIRDIGRAKEEITTVAEEVLKYEKSVKIYNNTLNEHRRRRALTDIIYIHLESFLHRMSEPYYQVPHYNKKCDTNEIIFCSRVYHINTVVKVTSKDEKNYETYYQFRIVLDRNGIKRIEDLKTL